MITEEIMQVIDNELDLAISLEAKMIEKSQPQKLIDEQHGVIEGLKVIKRVLGNYES